MLLHFEVGPFLEWYHYIITFSGGYHCIPSCYYSDTLWKLFLPTWVIPGPRTLLTTIRAEKTTYRRTPCISSWAVFWGAYTRVWAYIKVGTKWLFSSTTSRYQIFGWRHVSEDIENQNFHILGKICLVQPFFLQVPINGPQKYRKLGYLGNRRSYNPSF